MTIERFVKTIRLRGKKTKLRIEWETYPTEKPPEGSFLQEYNRLVIVVPGELYGRDNPTIFFYSERDGKHLTCVNKGGLSKRSVNYLGRELVGREPDRIVEPELD